MYYNNKEKIVWDFRLPAVYSTVKFKNINYNLLFIAIVVLLTTNSWVYILISYYLIYTSWACYRY